MSFRDTFTRGHNENLQYDDAASNHFFLTVLLLVFLPLVYSVLKSALFPFSGINSLKQMASEPLFRDKITKYKAENRFKFLTCGYFLKLVLALVLGFLILKTYQSVSSTKEQMKGFDPYEILHVSESATIAEIKKSYRRLALHYHPDRNSNDPQSAAMFIMISKAYECLTDDKAKQNCLKFGNPEGTNSLNVGIALPEILVRKQNQVKVMLFVLIVMVIIIPSILIYLNTGMDSVDEEGALTKNHPNILRSLNQNLSIKNVLSIVSTSWQFERIPTKSKQLSGLETLFNQISSEDREAMNIKKNYFNFFKKSFVLIDAHMNSRKVPAQLHDNNVYLLKTVPKLMNSIINLSLPYSTLMYKLNPHPQQNFVGISALESLIWFEQRFIQGCNLDAPEVAQLGLTYDQLQKISKKRRNKLLSIRACQTNQEEMQKFLGLLEENRRPSIKSEILSFPQVDVEAAVYTPGQAVYTPGQEQIHDKGLVEVKITVNRKNPCQYVISNRYPYLKQERWYCFLVQNKALLYYSKFTFEGQNSKEFVYNHPVFMKPGTQDWRVYVLPDSYFGLDLEVPLKFQVLKCPKLPDYKPHPEDEEIDANQTMFSRLLNNLVPQEDQELSDKGQQQKEDIVEQQQQA